MNTPANAWGAIARRSKSSRLDQNIHYWWNEFYR